MTIEEQLHNVIQLLEATAGVALRNEETCKRLFELAELQSRNLTKLAETVEIAHRNLATEVAAYVTDSRERMKQLEANLDALIRIITAEHSNGKGRP